MEHVHDQDDHPLEHKGFDFEKYYEELGDKVSAKCVNVAVIFIMLCSATSVEACRTSYEHHYEYVDGLRHLFCTE